MKSAQKSNITLVIPTCDRHEFLEEIISYHRDYVDHMIILDGSSEQWSGINSIETYGNVSYHQIAGTSPMTRLAWSVDKIKTPYVIIRADRRQISNHSIACLCSFLDVNKDFVSADGFTILDYNKIYTAYNYSYVSKHCEAQDGIQRALCGMAFFEPTWYAVYRSEAFRSIFSKMALLTTDDWCFHEFFHCIASMLHGKHKRIPCMFMYMPKVQYTFDRTDVTEKFYLHLNDIQYIKKFCKESAHLLSEYSIPEKIIFDAVMCYKEIYIKVKEIRGGLVHATEDDFNKFQLFLEGNLKTNGYSPMMAKLFATFTKIVREEGAISLKKVMSTFTYKDHGALAEIKKLSTCIKQKAPHHFSKSS